MVNQASTFFCFKNYLKDGPLLFCSFSFSSRRRVVVYSSKSSVDVLIFFSRVYSPSRCLRLFRISFALFWRTERFPLRLSERFLRNLSSASYCLLFWIIYDRSLIDNSEICPFWAWVWRHNSSRAPSLHLVGNWLSPLRAWLLRNPFSLTDLFMRALTRARMILLSMFSSFWCSKIYVTRVRASFELLLLRLSVCAMICL